MILSDRKGVSKFVEAIVLSGSVLNFTVPKGKRWKILSSTIITNVTVTNNTNVLSLTGPNAFVIASTSMATGQSGNITLDLATAVPKLDSLPEGSYSITRSGGANALNSTNFTIRATEEDV